MPDPSRRREDVRRRILAATIELLAESSYRQLTIEGIAARAGVGKQTIYRWWSSKGAVVLDAFLEHHAAENAAGDADAVLPETGDVAADLRGLLRDTVAEFADHAFEAPYRALIVAMQDDRELADQVTERLMRPGREALRDWVARSVEAAQLDQDLDPDLVIELMFGPILHRWLLRTGPLTAAFADDLTDAVLRLLGHRTSQERTGRARAGQEHVEPSRR